MQVLKSAILAIFLKGPGWPCPVSTAVKSSTQDFKIIFVLGCYEFIAMLEGKQSYGSIL